MLNTIILLIAIFAASMALIALGAMLVLVWIARGESDVNGDPERDALDLPPQAELPRVICRRCKCVLIDGTGEPMAAWCGGCLFLESRITGLHPLDIIRRDA
ncbi:MAG: hypothetical protein ABS95_02525 [Verrucomicrobia bacterium SCN 57-15]|nr:MAG: hypothetical protein ABS95_02525 [Verrucomicrobia bacterium SCN 57-15]